MGMIRVSDSAEEKIRALADGRTITATVDALLAGGGQNLDKEYFDNKFREQQEALREMRSLIEDNLVDVVAAGDHANRSCPQDNDILDWDVFRYIVFDLCKDDSSPEWVSQSVHDAMDNLNDPITTIVLDGYIWAVNDYGKSKLLKVSPRIEEAIREGRCYE